MAGDDHSALSIETRPQTARKDSRKVPGGFEIDDDDDLSPTKPNFDFSGLMVHNTTSHAENSNRVPSLDINNLPSLPPGDSSLLASSSYEGGDSSDGHLDTLDEKAMRRHLMDIESSMLPGPSPIGQSGQQGIDDTYLFDRDNAQNKQTLPGIQESDTPTKSPGDPQDLSAFSPATPTESYQTPPPPHAEDSEQSENTTEDHGNTTSSLETMSSSPTAAAAARTVTRAISMASLGGYTTANEDDGESGHESEKDGEYESTPRKNPRHRDVHDDSSDERSTIRHQRSSNSISRFSADAGSTPGAALLGRKSSGTRPKFLRSRNASQRSSVSSLGTSTESHDGMTLGADYALQSGGAVPADGVSRNSSYMLSRSISLGSMASGIEESGHDRDGFHSERALATLDEEERNRERNPGGSKDYSPPHTPRASSRSLAAPTDTVIAQHVRNIHVPESLAKEYRSKNRPSSPTKTSGISAPSTLGRNGKNLTLKEQSSTIERLSKENFDLKLKIFFLTSRLDKLSDEGVKEMVSENVELKIGLATIQKDNKALKRKIKELEKKLEVEEGRPTTARSGASSEGKSPSFDEEGAREMEEELIYLRERVEEHVTEIEKLRNESLTREADKRKLADLVRTMGEKRGDSVDTREEMDVWKDLHEQEMARREAADEDNRKLREEIFRLKTEGSATGGSAGLNHTTNIYNITKKRQISPSRPRSVMSERFDDRNGAFSAGSTLVEELRKEGEQLRHENAELRREVGAQTSMLTSRNREKERLYQEIEDLKLGARRGGGSIAGDSILDRSASRAGAHQRSRSRESAVTRQTGFDDAEREDLENKNADLRDKINSLKLKNQELQRELETCEADFEIAAQAKTEAEDLALELQGEIEAAEADLHTMQTERDEALRGQESIEIEFNNLQQEAQTTIDQLEDEAEQRELEFERLQSELADRAENFTALQGEMRAMSDSLIKLEDDRDGHISRIQELEQELNHLTRELQETEKSLAEANSKLDRLTVQQESSQGEIAFLREEQDGDKIKIGDLESALRNAESSIRDERERTRELEQRLVNERHQTEVIAGKEKQEVQKFINELNREASTAKDEARRLRKSLTSREVEATEWKERLIELENNLREALGDLSGTRSSLLKVSQEAFEKVATLTCLQSVVKLQRELENTARELDHAKTALTEKDRLISQRDNLLESHGLESQKLSEMLDKERQAHRNTRHQHETFLKTHQHAIRTVSQQEARLLELGTDRQHDRKKISMLENTFKDQLTERNNLLLALWSRLSALCGTDWAHDNSLINGRALPSLEAVTTMLPGFSKNLLAAVKTIELLVGNFKSRVKTVERDLWKEYQSLEHSLEMRTKKLDRLETVVKSGVPGGDNKAELVKLRDANRMLKEQLASARNVDNRSRGRMSPTESPSPSPTVPTGPRNKTIERTSTLTRHHSTSAVETLERAVSSSTVNKSSSIPVASGGSLDEAGEQRWIFRLRELERRLKAEREARLLDRNGARKRLEEGERRNEELKAELERNKVRKETALH